MQHPLSSSLKPMRSPSRNVKFLVSCSHRRAFFWSGICIYGFPPGCRISACHALASGGGGRREQKIKKTKKNPTRNGFSIHSRYPLHLHGSLDPEGFWGQSQRDYLRRGGRAGRLDGALGVKREREQMQLRNRHQSDFLQFFLNFAGCWGNVRTSIRVDGVLWKYGDLQLVRTNFSGVLRMTIRNNGDSFSRNYVKIKKSWLTKQKRISEGQKSQTMSRLHHQTWSETRDNTAKHDDDDKKFGRTRQKETH